MAARPRFDTDYYRILGVPPATTEDEIRRAYRRLALQWHPDRNPGDPRAGERFKEISEAYAVLVDPAKRREYDRARRAGAPGEFRHTREDLFRDLFADPRASAIFEELAREFERLGMRVESHHFQQTLFGGRAVVTGGFIIVTPLTPVLALFRLARAALRGAAAPPADARATAALPRPQGILGRVGRAGRWLLGLPSAPSPGGPGDVIVPLRLSRAEAAQGGPRRVTIEKTGAREEVLVRIPPGIRDGTRLRLRGKGLGVPGHPPGDAYLAVEVAD